MKGNEIVLTDGRRRRAGRTKENLVIKNTFRAFLCACLLLLPASFLAAQEGGRTVVTVDNAGKTEYQKDAKTGDELIVLTGNVSMSIASGDTRITITAATVRYDRKTSMLFAQGNVRLRQSGGSMDGQDATADSLLFNTSTLEGVFDNSRIVQARSDAIAVPEDSTLVISSRLMGKNAGGTASFKKASLTFCDDDNPHWQIKASRIWLLPGGEFAFLNAVLYVGHVPVAYLPAFYYPKDELLFNPVFGYDNRKGYYFQTTTYLLGRKPLSAYGDGAEDGAGLDAYNFVRPTRLKEQRREGVVLHNLDEDYAGGTDDYLKLLADYYSNFGGMVGLEGAYRPKRLVQNVEGFVDMGFSNTVFYKRNAFTRYASDKDVYYDSSNFLGFHVPFRYGAGLKLSVTEPFSFSLSLPVYSDPYFDTDYGDRKEFMDWIGFLTSTAEITDADKNTDESARKVSTFTWNATASYDVPLPDSVRPQLSTVRGTASSSIVFNAATRSDAAFYEQPRDWRLYSPERSFFYPSQVTLFQFDAEIAGAIYEFRGPSAYTSLPLPDSSGEALVLGDGAELPDLDIVSIPTLAQLEGMHYRLGYSLTPAYVSQYNYSTAPFVDDNTFHWDDVYSSYYRVTSPFALTSDVSYRQSFLSMSNKFVFDPLYQRHPRLDGYTTEVGRNAVRVADYEARKLDVTNVNTVSVRPFLYDPVFRNSGLDWNSSIKVFRTKFIGDADNPDWDYLTADLGDEESVTVHTVSAILSAEESERTSQKLVLTSTLPPQNREYLETLNLTFPYLALNFATGVKRSADGDSWIDEPFKQSAALTLLRPELLFTESFNYDLEDDHADSLKLALSFYGVQLAYTMQHTYGADYDEEKGWVDRSEKEFQPYTLSVAYATPSKTFRYWKNRIMWAPALSTSLVYNYVKPTDSYFTFIPSLTFRIHQFLDITFSSESRNSVVFRYVEDYTRYGEVISGEKNPFVDLFNSFAFWDTSLRKQSGFKLKNLKITVKHNLHDWDFSSTFLFQPRLIAESDRRPYYSYEPYFSFAVTWRPMGGIRTELVDEYGTLQLNP